VSTTAQIREVYNRDIALQTHQVFRKFGPGPFYAGPNVFMHIESMFGPKRDDGDTVIDWNRHDPDSDDEEY
jgi:hypothetical protein